MVQLDISVNLANILLWLFLEVFLLLMAMTATSLIVRYSISKTLLRGNDVPLNPNSNLNLIIDKLPYNSDLHLVHKCLKLPLTLCRLAIIAITIYIGANLGAEPREQTNPVPVSSTLFLGPRSDALLISNSGDDISAMAKLSCLRIVTNNKIHLYKSFIFDNEEIICEDGVATFSKSLLLEAEIRATFRTPKEGLDMSGMPMFESTFENESARQGLKRSGTALTVNITDESGTVGNVSTRIVLIEPLENGKCLFGFWRSAGDGFEKRVDVKLHAQCTLQIAALERMFWPKPVFVPPRMSFLFQVIDAALLAKRETKAPPLRDQNEAVATLPVVTIVIGARRRSWDDGQRLRDF